MYLSDIQKSFEKTRMDIPKAPGNGLLLEKLHYESYDKKFGKTHEPLSEWGEEVDARIQKNKSERILGEILNNEIKEQMFVKFYEKITIQLIFKISLLVGGYAKELYNDGKT